MFFEASVVIIARRNKNNKVLFYEKTLGLCVVVFLSYILGCISFISMVKLLYPNIKIGDRNDI